MPAFSGSFAPAAPLAPYCGGPPRPETLLHRWNLDPVLIAVLLAALVVYAATSGRDGAISRPRRLCFYGGWAIGALALVSPLCALSVSLFSARVGQHMLLTMIAAPMIALGLPVRAERKGQPLLAAAAFAGVLWVWHAPGPYTATFTGAGVYWMMHLTTFGAALWLWSALLGGLESGLAGFAAASLATSLQMSLLGALITFAGRPLYLPHQATTTAWGLTPLEDQQLGGVIMWVPAGAVLVAAFVIAFTQVLRRAETRALARPLV